MKTIQNTIRLWESKRRRMGCVSAINWFCNRHKKFKPKRLTFYTKEGEEYQHVVATDGKVIIDLSPYACKPKSN